MPSPAQLAANLRNAKRSTGPRTPKGKALAARNSVRHGLLSQGVILKGEDQQLFQDRADSLRADLKPFGGLQESLVAELIKCEWQRHRAGQMEASLFRYHILDHEVRQARRLVDKFSRTSLDGVIEITDRSQYAAAVRRGEEAEALRDRETLAIAFIGATGGGDTLSKLSRYQARIERSRDKALAKFERSQAAHGKGPVIRRRGLDAFGIFGRSRTPTW